MHMKSLFQVCKLYFLLLLTGVVSACGRGECVQYLASEERDGYICHLIAYETPAKEPVKAYLLEPKGEGPFPALVLLHDHGARFDIGKEKLVRPLEGEPEHIHRSSEQWIRDHFDGVWLADRLAQEGYVVIVPDMLYWGSRSSEACQRWSRAVYGRDSLDKEAVKALKKEVYEGQRAVYDSLYARGIVWARQTLEEDQAAVEILAAHKKVNPERIGAFGWSMGAHRCWLLSAFTPQVKTGCALAWMTLKRYQKEPYPASEYAMLIPEWRARYDFPDIASYLRPKPFFFLSGTQDKLFPQAVVDSCYTRMHALYGEADEALRTEFFPGPHHCGAEVQERILGWFREEL